MVSRILQFQTLVIVLLVFLSTSSNFVRGKTQLIYDDFETAAFRTLWNAWQGTPDLSINLPGWNNKTFTFCEYLDSDSSPANTSSWQGVQCSYSCNVNIDCGSGSINVSVVGLVLSDASIVGVLPDNTIYDFTRLNSLELTGNPDLTGPLPEDLELSYMNKLDLHDNAFTGNITNLRLLYNLLELDLSGNQFNGSYPLEELSKMNYLQKLSLGKNLLSGELDEDAFASKTELEILTLNDNNFTGALPNLTYLHKLVHLDVSGNHFTGSIPSITGQFPVLEYVNLSRNNFSGTLDLQKVFNLNASTSLATVDLSHNKLSGQLPSWTDSSLGSIQQLYLDYNNLTGILNISQMFAAKLLQENASNSSTTKLKTMSLSNNSIHDVISDAYIITHVTTNFMLDGNPYCRNMDPNNDAQRCYCLQICFISPAKVDSRKVVTIAASTSVAAVLLVSLLIAWAVLLKNRRYKRYLQLKFEERFEELDVKPTIFTYSELKTATRDFHDDMKLGQGGYGAVYKGVLPSGHVVAIKQLHKTAQAHDDFLNEVALITGMKHRNLVNLRGCCLREPQRLLVYEYVDNFDVDQVLLGSKKEEMKTTLGSWPARHKICLGIAHGLHYLHAMAHPRVIHRDIKAGNVLLNSHLEAKIADFGLALLFPDEQSHIMTVHVAGTKGYLAPEYAQLGQLSDKVDVYSFGILCLEIISGRHCIELTAPEDQVYLSKWAWKLHEENKLMDVVEPTLEVSAEEVKDVKRFLLMCLQCISIAAEKRPNMARIVSILQGDTESEMHVLVEEGKPSSKLLVEGNLSELGTLWELEDGSSTSSVARNTPYGHSSALQMTKTRPR